MNILLIEDDDEKSKRIFEFLKVEFPDANIELAKSVNSGLRSLVRLHASLSIVILDMSMPNFDISVRDPVGGKHESLAGKAILAQMSLRRIDVPTIVLTMFDKFGEEPKRITITELVDQLSSEYENFRGLVYYSTAQEGWMKSLKALIDTHGRMI